MVVLIFIFYFRVKFYKYIFFFSSVVIVAQLSYLFKKNKNIKYNTSYFDHQIDLLLYVLYALQKINDLIVSRLPDDNTKFIYNTANSFGGDKTDKETISCYLLEP